MRELTSTLILALPFVKKARGGRFGTLHFWKHDITGLDYGTANLRGEEFALESIGYMLATKSSVLFNWALMDMPDSDETCERGLQIGFIATFGRLAMFGAHLYGLERFRQLRAAENAEIERRCGKAKKAAANQPRRRAASREKVHG